MFSINTIGDLIDLISQLEVRHEDYYAKVRDNSTDNDARLLSYYLIRQYRYFRSQLKEAGSKKVQSIRKRQLRKKILVFPEKWLDIMNIAPSQITGRNLLDAAIKNSRKLIALYRNILKHPLAKDASLLVNTLLILEKKESVNLKKMLSMNYF